ncbi:hypothetical protein K3169_13820 [Pseudomonas phytophila]|uniref:DUF2802 domain-containing protein n=1 Tax=Pseudomonas phytophila TaxID=2867264 RepID=A0ABY6FLK6_9PSED|nr:hypothetical protein [Pseudomonas phytophila]UXZ98861.1 hypothetical protein K3169_13820 [Pseudomonas phytophila]
MDTGTDWTVVFGFALTAVAVLVGAWVSIYTFKRTARSQMTLAKAVALKESRQAWINELRETCAEFIATISAMQAHATGAETHGKFIQAVKEHDQAAAAGLKESWEAEKRKLLMAAFSLNAKIHLLSNPSEPAFQRLNAEALKALELANSPGSDAYLTCGRIVELAQQILKTEWNRAKEMQ